MCERKAGLSKAGSPPTDNTVSLTSVPEPMPSTVLCSCNVAKVSPVINVVRPDPNSHYSWRYNQADDPERLISPWSESYKLQQFSIFPTTLA